MIYNFDSARNFIRTVTYNGRNSYDDFSLTMSKESETPSSKPRIVTETVPLMDGHYDFSDFSGALHFDNLEWNYVFNLLGDNIQELTGRLAEVRTWLLTYGNGDLIDSNTDEWKYLQARCTGIEIEHEQRGFKILYKITAAFSAAPYMRSNSGKLIDIATLTPAGDRSVYIFNRYHSTYCVASMETSTNVPADITADGDGYVITLSGKNSVNYCGLPKNIVTTAERRNNSDIIGADDDYTYIRGVGTSFKVYVAGASVIPDSLRAMTCLVTEKLQSISAAELPDMENFRLISDGDPTLTIDGETAHTERFKLTDFNVLAIANARSDTCIMQYCTVKERM